MNSRRERRDGLASRRRRSTSTPDVLARGRMHYAHEAWGSAFADLSAADRSHPLEAEDLERLALSAHLIGRDAEAADAWTRAHHLHLDAGRPERAARCAFWLAHGLFEQGERARGSGWIARARRLLDGGSRDCAEQGYLLLPLALQHIGEGDHAEAYATFERAAAIGERFADRDLVALARHGAGRALIRMGDIDAGVASLDEAMVAIEAGELSPIVIGDVYCSVIEGCMEIFDLRRAQEWTSALTEWCAARPEVVPYSGQCLVRRAEVLQLHGAWREAADSAQQACERFLRGPAKPAIGAAFYQQAELYRLRGEFDAAERAYRDADRWGRKPQPGLALLRLAQGRVDDALGAIRRAVDEGRHPAATRARLLAALVEISLAAGDVERARAGSNELREIAASLRTPLVEAMAGQSDAAVLVADGDAAAALAAARPAWSIWQSIEAPYEAARVRVLLGLACRLAGDRDSADMEFEAAKSAFRELGAAPELARVERLSGASVDGDRGSLTRRELEVLRHVSAGKTNRSIAAALGISEKTVARHVSNIYLKLGLASRAAATAYAYEHGLI